ncbi:MAG: D-alanyl-D-alanine carboxypeptidase [Chitinophagaceae bacterium]
MKRVAIVIVYLLGVEISFSQSVTQKLEKAWNQFENDDQLKHAVSSLYVIDAATGKVVFDKNSSIGLAPASTQKIITAATAFDLLGKDYRYKTEFSYDGEIKKDTLKGNLYLIGYGDPTLGSWRYKSTTPEKILDFFAASLVNKNVKVLEGSLYIDKRKFSTQTIPDGWIWQDIGNYYGAGSGSLNWKENQRDVILKSGPKEGDTVKFVIKNGKHSTIAYGMAENEIRSGKPGSGDNAYAYFSPGSESVFYRGTIPVNEDSFKISVSLSSPEWTLYHELNDLLIEKSFKLKGDYAKNHGEFEYLQNYYGNKDIRFTHYGLDSIGFEDSSKFDPFLKPVLNLYTHYSPSLDSIVYWFLRKSINLYGEALVKTFSYEKNGYGATDTGVNIVKDFWKKKGLDVSELNLYDGSGLSPLNRVTTHAQVEVLKYAKQQNWFNSFYDALPEYNGMKMKSGTISDVKAFCGYQKAKDGKEYIFSFIVNNYNGISLSLVNKMYKVLDILK